MQFPTFSVPIRDSSQFSSIPLDFFRVTNVLDNLLYESPLFLRDFFVSQLGPERFESFSRSWRGLTRKERRKVFRVEEVMEQGREVYHEGIDWSRRRGEGVSDEEGEGSYARDMVNVVGRVVARVVGGCEFFREENRSVL